MPYKNIDAGAYLNNQVTTGIIAQEDADNTDDKTCDNKYRQLFGFPHGNFLSELDLWGCRDRFFELQVFKLD